MYHYFTASTISELICFIFAAICLLKDTSVVWRCMILYLLITCIAEFAGVYVEIKSRNNQWVYNIFLLFEGGFTILMFGYIFNQFNKSKLIIISGLVLFAILYIYELLSHGFFVYNYLTYKVMSILYVLYSFYYYYLLLNDAGYVRLKYASVFWWVTGTLFFYFGNTAVNLFDKHLAEVKIFGDQYLTYFIYKVLNITLYGCWSYSFICRKLLTLKSKT